MTMTIPAAHISPNAVRVSPLRGALNNEYVRLFGRVARRSAVTVALALWLVGFALSILTIAGGKVAQVISPSMTPKYQVGAVVLERPVRASDLKVGQVVTAHEGGDALITHRIYSVTGSGSSAVLRLKGDHNETPDAILIHPSDVKYVPMFAVQPSWLRGVPQRVLMWLTTATAHLLLSVLVVLYIVWISFLRRSLGRVVGRPSRVYNPVPKAERLTVAELRARHSATSPE